MASEFKNEIQRLKKTLVTLGFVRDMYSTNYSAIYSYGTLSVSYELDKDEYGFGYWVWIHDSKKKTIYRRHLKDRFEMKLFTKKLPKLEGTKAHPYGH